MNSLIKRYLSGKSTVNEQKELLTWLRKNENLSEFQRIKSEWKKEIRDQQIPVGFDPDWNSIQQQFFGQINNEVHRTRRLMNYFRYAAIFLLLISIPAIFYIFYSSSPKSSMVYTTVAADFGQISKVVLPDSTVIWVNSGSAITYDDQFGKADRNVQLIGEAYFKVHKNKNLPMVVTSSALHVTVLGTEFCITAYPEEKNIQVVLEKGSIELTSDENSNFRQKLKPGDLASFDKKKKDLTISSVNTELFTSWKDGIINIYNLPLSEVVIRLEKRYNQQFRVDKAIRNLPYTFTIKNEKLDEILSLMEKITPLDAVQHGNVIELKYNRNKKLNGTK